MTSNDEFKFSSNLMAISSHTLDQVKQEMQKAELFDKETRTNNTDLKEQVKILTKLITELYHIQTTK